MVQVKELANTTAEIATKLGIEKYDIYGVSVDSTGVEVERGEPKQVKASNRSTVIVRVWNDKKTMGVTTTTDVDSKGIELALKTAYEASAFGVKEHTPDFSPEAKADTAEIAREIAPSADVPTLLEKLLAAEKELVQAHRAIASVPYNGLSQRNIDRFYLNSNGALRDETSSANVIYLYAKTEEEGKKPRSAGSYKTSESLAKLDIDTCVKEAAEKTISHLNYEKIKSGKYRVVFSGEAFLGLLSAFSNLFNAQSILDKQSLSSPESLGQQIASPLLSVCDDALHPENIGADTFDGEGTPTRRTPIITEGVLSSFLHSAGTAKRLKAQPTGNASLGAKVSVSPNFYHVFPGRAAEQSYSLDTAENVILIDDLSALHAGVSALQGSFSLPFDGWLINKGERTSIDAATIAGDFREVLKSIIYVEPELELTPGGVCPRIWVDDLSVTGE
ncbi:MAG: TldD/PmbA family protein [Cyanobacteriota bacterium]|nr:TldD/PmbA family protein [Cyanobacteriota bacterium]